MAGALADATAFADCATCGIMRSTAVQIRVAAVFRSVNFLTGFRSAKGATPAKLFRVSTSREIGHAAVSLASSFWLVNDADLSASPGVRRTP